MIRKVFTDDQNVHCVETRQENLDICKSDPKFLNNFIIGDESWVFEYDPKTKRHLSTWHPPRPLGPKKTRMGNPKSSRCLLGVFFVKKWTHYEFVPFGTTLNAKYYFEALKKLKRMV